MNLQNWVDQARAHWKEHLPTLYRDLSASGKLVAALKNAADRTDREMSDLRAVGYNEQEAWEIVRESYLFPPEEGSAPKQNDSPLLRTNGMGNLTDVLHGAMKSGAREVPIPQPMTAATLTSDLKGK